MVLYDNKKQSTDISLSTLAWSRLLIPILKCHNDEFYGKHFEGVFTFFLEILGKNVKGVTKLEYLDRTLQRGEESKEIGKQLYKR